MTTVAAEISARTVLAMMFAATPTPAATPKLALAVPVEASSTEWSLALTPTLSARMMPSRIAASAVLAMMFATSVPATKIGVSGVWTTLRPRALGLYVSVVSATTLTAPEIVSTWASSTSARAVLLA